MRVHLRLHLFFFLAATLLVYITSHAFAEPNWLGFVAALVLFLSVLLHEIGHVMVARHLGGVADEIVLGPVGGLAPVRVPFEPHSELLANIAGCLVNAVICCFAAVGLVAFQGETAVLPELFGSRIFSYFETGQELSLVNVLQLVLRINWLLILLNLLPVFPFDGGRALQSILGFLWPDLDSKQATLSIARLGKVLSVVFLVISWYYFQPSHVSTAAQPPVWLVAVLLAIYTFFCARLEEFHLAEVEHQEDTVFGYDFSQGYTSLERSLGDEGEGERQKEKNSSPFQLLYRWMEQRKARQEQRLKELESEDERRIDEVLARLHEGGMKSLSADDRALLDRVSKRYRSRPTQ